MARDLETSEYGYSTRDSLLREAGAFYSSAYNWLLQLNTAYVYSMPHVIGGSSYSTISGQNVFRCFFEARGPVVEISGVALDRTTFGGPCDGTWITPGGVTVSHEFTESLSVTPGTNIWVGTFVADDTHQRSVVITKRESW
jgi:hypothetical protein